MVIIKVQTDLCLTGIALLEVPSGTIVLVMKRLYSITTVTAVAFKCHFCERTQLHTYNFPNIHLHIMQLQDILQSCI